jgi:hypothetical protein
VCGRVVLYGVQNSSLFFFFLEYAGELRITVLIEGKMEPYRTSQGNTLVPTHTHTAE